MKSQFATVLRSSLVLVIALVLCSVGSALVAAPAKSLREVLTAEEFAKAGLNKLSEEELAFLSARVLAQESSGASAVNASGEATPIASLPQGEAAFGHEQKLGETIVKVQRVPKQMRSRIVGPFKGWRSNTQFKLENGQVWQVIDGSSFDEVLESPEVLVEKGLVGTFFLSIKGYGSRCKVKRIK